MFKIKICGITTFDDALMALDLGTQAIGLNFYPGSRRCVGDAVAGRIAEIVPNDVWKVGVFVNESARQVTERASRIGLTAVQLHGNEPPELLRQLPQELKIVRAYRCGSDGLAPLSDYLAKCGQLGRMPDAVLIDSRSANQAEYGGTGQAADWQQIARDRAKLGDMPLVLAGGLTAENVAAAIEAVRPDGVDVASGVESSPGRKDPELVDRFIAEAFAAFARYS